MAQNQLNKKIKVWNNIIILLSIIGLIACITVLFPQVRRMIMDWAEQMMHQESSTYQSWLDTLLSYALGGICFILLFDYCTLTNSGRTLVQKVKQEIKDCFFEIDFKAFVKPGLLMFIIYLLGIFTIIRANVLYIDDIGRAAGGGRGWYNWSRYISDYLSILIHGDTVLTEISPLPQLLAILMLSLSSVFLVYVISNKKITVVGLLASIPLGLSPYFLECLSYKFDAPYMALAVLASIVPFLFIARKKAFLFISIVSLLVLCMSYQAASGIYPLIVLILCFRDWNNGKSNKEIFSFLGLGVLAFCLSMIIFKLFFVKPYIVAESTTVMHSPAQMIPGVLANLKTYLQSINQDFGLIWKIIILIICFFFIIKAVFNSAQQKLVSFVVSLFLICFMIILSYGAYLLLEAPLFAPRALFGFGAFLAIICIYISDYKKAAIVAVLALNWCFMVFAFSYGNALADQNRYTTFRITILLHDLSILYPDRNTEDMSIQINNKLDFTPTVKNIAKHYPVIKRLVPPQLAEQDLYAYVYFLNYFNWGYLKRQDFSYSEGYVDYRKCDLPVVLDSYYHTIKSDGERILVILKH